jgi:hypothetical protein
LSRTLFNGQGTANAIAICTSVADSMAMIVRR